jgi:hypothetical protein
MLERLLERISASKYKIIPIRDEGAYGGYRIAIVAKDEVIEVLLEM